MIRIRTRSHTIDLHRHHFAPVLIHTWALGSRGGQVADKREGKVHGWASNAAAGPQEAPLAYLWGIECSFTVTAPCCALGP